MPSIFDKILRRKQPEAEPESDGLYSPPERGPADPDPSDFNVGDAVRAAGSDQSGAVAVADGQRRMLPDRFVVPDGTVGTVKGVDLENVFVSFPVEVPTTPWRHARGGPEFAPGDRLKAVGAVPTTMGTIPNGHVAVVESVRNGQLTVQLMLQFPKDDWWNTKSPGLRYWGSRRRNGPKRRKPNEKCRRIFREVWYARDGSNVLRSAAHGTAEGCRAVVLKPGAKVIDVSNDTLRKSAALDPDVERLVAVMEQQARAVADLTAVVNQLMLGGDRPDAVRTEDKLIVLNPEALQDEGPARRRWMQAHRNPGDGAPRAHAKWLDMPVSIEYFEGEERPFPGGSNVCPCSYGYFDDTLAMDGDGVDVLLGPNWQDPDADVWVVEQLHHDGSGDTLQFKTFLGFEDEAAVLDAFAALWPDHMLGEYGSCTPDEYRDVWFPQLNELPEVRTASARTAATRAAAGIVDLKGYDDAIARLITDAAFDGDWMSGDFLDRIREALPSRLMNVVPKGFLRKDEADRRFREVWLDAVASPLATARGSFLAPNDEDMDSGRVVLNLMGLFQDFEERPAYGKVLRRVREVLAHELRHAADWAYRGTAAWLAENPELQTAVERQETAGEPDKAYVNSPTELRSFAGSVADTLFNIYGDDVFKLRGDALSRVIADEADWVWSRVAPKNRNDFLTRVVQALQQRVQNSD